MCGVSHTGAGLSVFVFRMHLAVFEGVRGFEHLKKSEILDCLRRLWFGLACDCSFRFILLILNNI